MQIGVKPGNNSVDIFLADIELIVFKNFSSRRVQMVVIKDADVDSHLSRIHIPRVELPLLIHVLIVYLLSLLNEIHWYLFFLFFYFHFWGLYCLLFGGLNLLPLGSLNFLLLGRFKLLLLGSLKLLLLMLAEKAKDMRMWDIKGTDILIWIIKQCQRVLDVTEVGWGLQDLWIVQKVGQLGDLLS